MSLSGLKEKVIERVYRDVMRFRHVPGFNSLKPNPDLEQELKVKLDTLLEGNDDNKEMQETWIKTTKNLRDLVSKKSAVRFLRWKPIQRTMFVTSANFVKLELDWLKGLSDFETRWKKVISEDPVGDPIPYYFMSESSGNLIHHAYHLALFEKKSNVKIQSLDTVFEFGGGYGSMARLFWKLGFNGRYIIYDLPHFSMLQTFYLKALGLPVKNIKNFDTTSNGIYCVSDLPNVQFFANPELSQNSLFLATWSLSETPIELREKFKVFAANAKYAYIAYQHSFEGLDNKIYFSNFFKGRSVKLETWDIPQLPQNSYVLKTSVPL